MARILEPCPWDDRSGKHKRAVIRASDFAGPEARIVICQCGARGPVAMGDAKAIAAWNRRESPSFNEGRGMALRLAAHILCTPDPDLPTDRDAALGYLANEFIGRAETIERAAIDAARREQP